ncbi:hypothetical protein ACFSL4_12355 [Streptomyces caeni]|uniref:Uncharacterized protein n=1 Tax=Streptomyces caeni TaxID=2307231 RepID=A0ABW4IR42_9ACTN
MRLVRQNDKKCARRRKGRVVRVQRTARRAGTTPVAPASPVVPACTALAAGRADAGAGGRFRGRPDRNVRHRVRPAVARPEDHL